MKTELLAVLAQTAIVVAIVGVVVLKKGWVAEALLAAAAVGAAVCMALGLARLLDASQSDDLVGAILLVGGTGLILGAAAVAKSIFARGDRA